MMDRVYTRRIRFATDPDGRGVYRPAPLTGDWNTPRGTIKAEMSAILKRLAGHEGLTEEERD
jgi:hypothetical protein